MPLHFVTAYLLEFAPKIDMFVQILVISVLVCSALAASVKRDEYSSSLSTSTNNNNPVYSPASTSATYGGNSGSSYSSNGYNRDGSVFSGVNSASQYNSNGDHVASASSNSYQNQPQSNANLYYYYYPVQEKPKESTFQASSSNQYTSAVSPNSADSNQHPLDSSSGQDLSYGAQDLSYSAQTIGQGIGQGLSDYSNQGNNYDQTLSSLASQLQQYGFGTGSSGSSYNQVNGYSGSPPSYGSGNSFGLNGDSTGSAYGAAAAAAAAAGSGHIGNYGTAVPFPGSGSSFVPQTAPYPSYGGPNYGNYAAASGQHATYEPASSGYRRYGIGSIIMPMLALAGLSLLIPTVTSLGTAATGRRRRSADKAKESALGTYLNRLDRYYSLYKTAVEREECMNRIICELGDVMSNVRGKSTFFTVIEKLVPNWMGNKVGVLKNGALSPEYGKCKKYSCQ
ncbi:hypothetical protein B4U79_12403, partial [Dinothrombium tinctorium]